MRLRIRRRAKKELLVEGREEIYRIWVGRDWRVLYSIEADRGELIIEAVRRKGDATYRR